MMKRPAMNSPWWWTVRSHGLSYDEYSYDDRLYDETSVMNHSVMKRQDTAVQEPNLKMVP